MNTQDKKEGSTLTIVEAVETLSHIADLDIDRDIEIAQKDELAIQDKSLPYHKFHWLNPNNADDNLKIMRETFRVILNYLRNFYKKDDSVIYNSQALEGIKTIMVLVGEAAKKLDKYSLLFHKTRDKSVTELKEYKKLQEFYLNRIAKKVDEGTLGKWILALAQKAKMERAVSKEVKLTGKKSSQTKHVFVDLDSVKKDTEYELFLLRKEDGTRFFSPRLIRNIKLINDFGNYFGEEKLDDPLINLDDWQDRIAHSCAKNVIKSNIGNIERFYTETIRAQERDLIEMLNKAVMALMLAANPHNLNHNMPIKNCSDYFDDFQVFLRTCLCSRDYQRMVAYPPNRTEKIAYASMTLIHHLCMGVYLELSGYEELLPLIHALIQQSNENSSTKREVSLHKHLLWKWLEHDYAELSKFLKSHPNGPLNKILNAIEEGNYHEFDPLIQHNFPSQMFSLYIHEKKCLFTRWPSPTHQEFIHKAAITDEFKGFLRGCAEGNENYKCLVINLQDRVNWKEHFRSAALEDLLNQESLNKHLSVVTLAKDTEFYHQLSPYNLDNRADLFIEQFKKQLEDSHCGFFFPEGMKKQLSGFIGEAMKAIHRIFFSGKNMLLREHRMDFIEIFYLFLQLKLIETVKPDIVGFTCKDSLDIGSTAGAELFTFFKMLTQERLSENDREQLDLMLYGPTLLLRERVLLPERFNRMVSAVKVIETVREQCGYANFIKIIHEAFGRLYKTPILDAKVVKVIPASR